MRPEELDGVLKRLAARLRIRSAAARALLPVGALMAADLAAVLAVKLSGASAGPAAAPVLTGAVLFLCAATFGVLWALGPVSDLRAAAELDRLAGLKERTASLVDARARGTASARLHDALRADVERSIAPLGAEEVSARLAPLPAAARWVGVILAAILAALLLPARGRARTASLAEMLIDGEGLLAASSSAADGGEGPAPQRAEAARRVLQLLRAPAPASPEEAERRRRQLERLAEELRRHGAPDLAERLLSASLALGEAADPAAPGAGAPRGGESGPPVPGAERYPDAYAELLSRYFTGAPGQKAGGRIRSPIDEVRR